MMIESPVEKYWRKTFLNNNKEVVCYPFENDDSSYIKFTAQGAGDESFTDGTWLVYQNPEKYIVGDKIHTGSTVIVEFINFTSLKSFQLSYYKGCRIKIYNTEYPTGIVFNDYKNPAGGIIWSIQTEYCVGVTKIEISNFGMENQGLWFRNMIAVKEINILKNQVLECFDNNKLFQEYVLKQE